MSCQSPAATHFTTRLMVFRRLGRMAGTGVRPRDDDLIAVCLPPGPRWLDALRAAWDAGAAVLPVDARLTTAEAAAVLARARPTAVLDRDGWRRVPGGAALNDEAAARAARAFVPLVPTYGLTESCGGVVYAGRPLVGVEARIGGGEVLLRGPTLMRGYRFNEERTASVLRDGWLHTGD